MGIFVKGTNALLAAGGQVFLNHPLTQGKVNKKYEKLFNSTVRVAVGDSIGSGFWIVWGGERYIVTNAHVVGLSHLCTCEVQYLFVVKSFDARVVAVDHVHDIAVLLPLDDEVEASRDENNAAEESSLEANALELGESPLPGDTVAICGFPLGCESPRLLKGLVSGYEGLEIEGVPNISVVVQGPVNIGNSGGPVVDEDGRLCGVIWAINRRVRNTGVSSDELQTVDVIERSLTATDGFGLALDPIWIEAMLKTFSHLRNTTESNLIEKFLPKERRMSREDFVQLQRQCADGKRPDNCSTIGVFHYSPDDEVISLGWRGKEQLALDAPAAWIQLAKTMCDGGGHFVLHGYHVRLYRKMYSGWIVPFKLVLF